MSASMPAGDHIALRGITARGHHGVLPEERRVGQFFVVDLDLVCDLAPAAATDDLTRTVNYDEVANAVVAAIEGEPLHLIEALAERIADAVLTHELVQAVRVTVHKPHAPVTVPVTNVSVTLSRPRGRSWPNL